MSSKEQSHRNQSRAPSVQKPQNDLNKSGGKDSPSLAQREKSAKQAPFQREKGRGIVKAVLSGDTIIVLNKEKNQGGPPTGI